ncbi:hypothetical protein CC86DRAFT_3318 [Ophiobolus disseminans]|uniref:Uncharacterized protein n=1 Tax=Ophiobolus disseminans TaxID=1469910 RepID=A0A6A7AK77_9PLEO|nr:hypothetical protein CC86DRAFT_3318 [Ophiobolus disseminans]
MKTCPSLCATATVVGASAVGLSFGRETPFDSSHSSKKKASQVGTGAMPTAFHTSATTTTASAFSAPIAVAPASRMPYTTRLSQDGRPSRRMVRRMTSGDTASQVAGPGSVLNGYGPSDQDIAELDLTTHGPSRRRSWVKRLSSISNSQPSSRNHSPAPLSPSVSWSNGSMAFSHDGSTAPIMSRRSPSPLPPNKLVRRSSVQRQYETPVHGSGSLRPSFRRPATSHQRSATLQSPLLETTAEDLSASEHRLSLHTHSEPEYTHYFTARVAKERPLSKAQGFRRILPDIKQRPTLVLARSVSAGAEGAEEVESASEDGESVFFVSRPGTPLSITAVIATKTAPHPPAVDSDDASRPRRSFSITDLLSSAKRQRSARLSRRASQRASSAPLVPTMGRRRNSIAYTDTRRVVTDPVLARRAIATSAGAAASAESEAARHGPVGGSSLSPLTAHPVRCAAAVPGSASADGLASLPQLDAVIASPASTANHMPPSPTLAQSAVRPSRHSMAASEQASTLVGSSDNEVRGLGSGDEDDADLQSDTLFDSLRTGATRSTTGGPRGPRIETIFDESPPSKVKVTALRDLLPPGSFGEPALNGTSGQHSIAEEEESISTPVRTVRPERSLHDSPSFTRTNGTPLFPSLIPSSPPSMPKPLSLGTLEWDSRAADDDDSSRWSREDEDAEDSWSDLPIASHIATPVSLRRSNPRLLASGSSPQPTTPQHLTAEHADRDARSSIFDWSEQQPADKNAGNRSPPRPRTVHGKKDADRRGSRSVGRRVPSGLHARSQSVPVVPDAAGKRNTVVTNKFGTWGVGSKGVTEDWNDDFDFSELNEDPVAEDAANTPRVDSGTAMVVPKKIQEQQNNVLANIGLLREWGLLIEELKEHRIRAIALGIVEGPHSGMWEEVDAMIDLADQEADHEGVSRLSPPSSPGFDEDAFEDVPAPNASPSIGRGRRKSASPPEDLGRIHTQSQQPRRKTILPPNYAIFGPQSSPIPPKAMYEAPIKPVSSKPLVTRPRKDSEAKARSVIEALQNRKSTFEPVDDVPPTPSSKKVPFDTATLRRIVPYVNTLTRKVKDAIRDAEGLYTSPNTSPHHEEPPFSKIFLQDADLAAQMQRMTVM